MRSQYAKQARETGIIRAVASSMNRIVDRAYQDNPLPIGEERIDPRTARSRLQQVQPDDLFDYYSQHG